MKTMHSLTPQILEMVSFEIDSTETRYFQFRLMEPALFAAPLPGQFFMLSVPGHGEAAFTFATPPDQHGQFDALIRSSGTLTRALFEIEPGRRLGIRGPFGCGWPIAELENQRVLIVAGGCGLAPLNGLIEQLLVSEHCDQLILVYGARTSAQQVLNSHRERWNAQMQVTDVVEETDEGGTPLSIMPRLMAGWDEPPDRLLLCGPELMMQATAQYFLAQGFPAKFIWASIERRMHCAVGLCGHCYLEHQYACTDGPTYRWDRLQPVLRQSA